MKMPTRGSQDSFPFMPNMPHQLGLPQHPQQVSNIHSSPVIPAFGCEAASEEGLGTQQEMSLIAADMLHCALIGFLASRFPEPKPLHMCACFIADTRGAQSASSQPD